MNERWAGSYDAPDRYQLTELRSRGGEGELWAGWVMVGNERLPVAVKVLHPSADAGLDELSDRLRDQAELLRSLDHPNLVKVREAFDGPALHGQGGADPQSRSLYLVMNWVQGENLGAWVTRTPERDVLHGSRIVSRLAAAIDYLHTGRVTNGVPVLHRDIKPANVLVDEAGEVCLVDFGLARFASGEASTFAGTPAYLAPEVMAGAPPTAASDRFGLGATAYFLFTGEGPNLTDPAGMRAKLRAVAGIEDHDGFTDHVLAMMSKDPARRPTSATEWAQGLAVGTVSRSFQPLASVATAAPRRRRRWILAPAAAVVVLVAAAAGFLLLAGGDDDQEPVVAAAAASDDESEARGTSPAADVVEVPDVVGEPLVEARRTLREEGFGVEVEYEESTEEAGTVLSQDPEAGEEDAEKVALVVAEAASSMPDVTGLQLTQAERELEALGLRVVITEVLDDESRDGLVTEQEPIAGADLGDEATLIVARQSVITTLNSLEVVEGSANNDLATVSGVTYTRSVLLYLGCCDDYRAAGYDLGRDQRRFKATLGLADDSPSGAVGRAEVFGDGRSLFSRDIALGEAVPVDLDVTGVLRLTIAVTKLGEQDYFSLVWGDAVLVGAPGEVPTTTTTVG